MKNIFVIILYALLSCNTVRKAETYKIVSPPDNTSVLDVPEPMIALGVLSLLPLLMLIYYFIPKSLKNANNHV